MECVVHPAREAVDACRSCGKPICAGCGEDSAGSYVCSHCDPRRPAAEASIPTPVAVPIVPKPRRQPALAALLSFFPGLGQLYNGDYLKALTVFAVTGLLIQGSIAHPPLAVFLGLVWFYQVFEAFHAAARFNRPVDDDLPEEPRVAALTAWALIVLGLLLFAENLTGAVLPRMRVLLPAAVIAAGLFLIVSYFRTGEGSRA